MTLNSAHRTNLYGALCRFADPEAVDAMLAHFPTRDADEPVNREFLRAEVAVLRSELRGEMAELRSELRGEMADLRVDLTQQLHAEVSRLDRSIEGLRQETVNLRSEMTGMVHAEIRRSTQWLLGAVATSTATLAAVVSLTG